jgi:hypothetical protein
MSTGFDRVGLNVEREGYAKPEDPASEQKQKQELHNYADERLKALVSTDEMYYAMENFLLGNPERQIRALGDLESVLNAGDEAKSKDDHLGARTNYETAAKLYLYKQNKEGLRNCLILAQEITDETDKHFRFQTAIMDNIDEALRVAKTYYEKIPGAKQD